jgi:hypothetical protein
MDRARSLMSLTRTDASAALDYYLALPLQTREDVRRQLSGTARAVLLCEMVDRFHDQHGRWPELYGRRYVLDAPIE